MSNRMFQSVIHQTKEAIERTVGIIDENLTVIACSDLGRVGEVSTMSVESFTVGKTLPACYYLIVAE